MAIGLYGGMQYWEYPCELALVADQLPITSVVMSCAFVAEILNDTAAKIIKLDSDHESETKIYVREAVAMLVLTQITMIVIVIATDMLIWTLVVSVYVLALVVFLTYQAWRSLTHIRENLMSLQKRIQGTMNDADHETAQTMTNRVLPLLEVNIRRMRGMRIASFLLGFIAIAITADRTVHMIIRIVEEPYQSWCEMDTLFIYSWDMRIALLLFPAAILYYSWSSVGDSYASLATNFFSKKTSRTSALKRKGKRAAELVNIKLEPSAVKSLQEMKQRALEMHIITMKTNERRTSLSAAKQGIEFQGKMLICTPLSKSEGKETLDKSHRKRSSKESSRGITSVWKSRLATPKDVGMQAGLDTLNLSVRSNIISGSLRRKDADSERCSKRRNTDTVLSNYQLDKVSE
eukprot:CAMPEP_0170172044 /NCGR_PEP_ID=MMETSP0040_2-20121228/5270_1 /TAXON_ID=641309 /ORGANISM="Lotharella oceanica, Strain CCMP622" /LENGTH=404 /DNA_ID=CAMNT_0010412487 /DNA_START=201 /DNA_END=1415 /DNA_ORIENTATION=+